MAVPAGRGTTGNPARVTGATGIDRATVARTMTSVTMTRSCLKEEKAMTDDIVKYLRLSRTRFNRHAEAANEIERLRAERLQWFVVARQLRDALLGTEEKDAAVDEYLRTRGRLEDPREQAEG